MAVVAGGAMSGCSSCCDKENGGTNQQQQELEKGDKINSLPYLRIVHVLRVKTFLNAENISIFVGEIRFWHMALINGII